MMRRGESLTIAIGLALLGVDRTVGAAPGRPNVILCMSDDQGWGDTGYNGHPVLKTPHLDRMAREGVRFERFYSAAPVCSPTRGSCLTGRHPQRYGIVHANAGNGPSKYPLPSREVTLAEILETGGYRCGHFGKWHLGDFSGPMRSSPADNGFETSFSTVRKVATVDPVGYFSNGKPYVGALKGDDSRLLMDRAVGFIESAARDERPFFAVIWFHTPHLPVFATPRWRALYKDHSEREQHYWGALSALDAQMGRLRETLDRLGVADDTMLWFASDNGPEGKAGRAPGSTGGFRGRKRDLWEGGIRVPGLLVWPARIPTPRVVSAPCVTSDYLPTILDALDLPDAGVMPRDGISLLPILEGRQTRRGSPIAFEFRKRVAVVDDRYKLTGPVDGSKAELHDLIEDGAETTDLTEKLPAQARRLKALLSTWRESCRASLAGND